MNEFKNGNPSHYCYFEFYLFDIYYSLEVNIVHLMPLKFQT